MERFKIHIVTYVSMLVLAVTSILYTTIAQRQTEQKFCSVVNATVDALKSAPEPKDADARTRLQTWKDNYAQLQNDLHCR